CCRCGLVSVIGSLLVLKATGFRLQASGPYGGCGVGAPALRPAMLYPILGIHRHCHPYSFPEA
ncbi:MAG TPA: hypothetical protein VFQ09_00190, partial [Rubrobacter sp.]|nr:hypothetical protein [Rubrobacter sp.]